MGTLTHYIFGVNDEDTQRCNPDGSLFHCSRSANEKSAHKPEKIMLLIYNKING